MKRRGFISGLLAGPLWLKTRFLAVKTKFFGPKAPRVPKYVIVPDQTQAQIVELPDGSVQFPDGTIIRQEIMAGAVKNFLAELKEHPPPKKAIDEIREVWANFPQAMKRRNFLIGGIAASAAVRAWPFRVYSFPSQIVTMDFAAEKEKYIRLALAYIDAQAPEYGAVEALLLQHGIVTSSLFNGHVWLNPR